MLMALIQLMMALAIFVAGAFLFALTPGQRRIPLQVRLPSTRAILLGCLLLLLVACQPITQAAPTATSGDTPSAATAEQLIID